MPTGCSMLVLAALLTTPPSAPGTPAHGGASGCGDVTDPVVREEPRAQAVRQLAAAVAGDPDPGSRRLGAAQADAGLPAPPPRRQPAVEPPVAAESDDPRVPPVGEPPATEAGRADDLISDCAVPTSAESTCAVPTSAESTSATDAPPPTRSRRGRGEAAIPGCPSVDASCSRPAQRSSSDRVPPRRTDPRPGSSGRSLPPPTAVQPFDRGAGVAARRPTTAPFVDTGRTARGGLPAPAVLDARPPEHSGGRR